MTATTSEAIADLLSLRGRVALVTGAARGIGFASAARLAEAGATVLLADRDADAAQDAAGRIAGAEAHPVELDVTDEAALDALLDRVEEEHGGVDLLVNSAGIYPNSPALETTTEEWDRVLEINLRAVFLASRNAARRMVAAGRPGTIVNIASGAGAIRSYPAVAAHYSTSKAGVGMLTKQLAIELGPHGIRVLAVAPGVTMTEGVRSLEGFDAFSAEIAASNPLRRVCSPDDIARAVLFCASGLADAMTGDVLAVDCGQIL